MNFDNDYFKEFSEYVMKCWRPATEAAIQLTEDANMYKWMCDWFSFLDDPNIVDVPDDCKVNIELYVGVYPYAKHFVKEKNGDKIYEFLFLYDSININKITKEQLTLGREDFIDLEPRH